MAERRRIINLVGLYLIMRLKPVLNLLLITLSFAAIIISGCGKDEPLVPNPNPNAGRIAYTIVGVKDVSLERVGETKMQINIERISGNKDTEIKLGVSDLPDGLNAFFDVDKSTTPYISFITFVGTRVLEGSYNIKITGSGQDADFKEYPMVVKILPYTNAADGVKGQYVETHTCSADGYRSVNVRIVADLAVKNKVIIKGFWSGTQSNEVTALIDPATHTISIPEQTHFNVTFTGNGTYTDDKIDISYIAKGPSFTDNCTASLDRVK